MIVLFEQHAPPAFAYNSDCISTEPTNLSFTSKLNTLIHFEIKHFDLNTAEKRL